MLHCVDDVQLAVYDSDSMSFVTFVGVVKLRFQMTVFTIAVNEIPNRWLRQCGYFLIHPR